MMLLIVPLLMYCSTIIQDNDIDVNIRCVCLVWTGLLCMLLGIEYVGLFILILNI